MNSVFLSDVLKLMSKHNLSPSAFMKALASEGFTTPTTSTTILTSCGSSSWHYHDTGGCGSCINHYHC